MAPAGQYGISADARALMVFQAKRKSVGVSYAFWVFLGIFGGHRFYNGRVGSGFAIAILDSLGLVLLLCGNPFGALLILPASIWGLVDAFLIPGWVSNHNAKLIAEIDGARPGILGVAT